MPGAVGEFQSQVLVVDQFLTTAHVADACIRARVPVRCASALLRAVVPGSRLAGRVCPARHAGSVDAFLEAFEMAAPGDVLVVDNGGRLDETAVGLWPAQQCFDAGQLAAGQVDLRLIPDRQAVVGEILAQAIHLGPTKPTKRIAVFEDVDCPFCKKFHADTLPGLLEDGVGVEVFLLPLPQLHPTPREIGCKPSQPSP